MHINAIFKEMRILCGMRLSQVLGTNLFGLWPNLFQHHCSLAIGTRRCSICVNMCQLAESTRLLIHFRGALATCYPF